MLPSRVSSLRSATTTPLLIPLPSTSALNPGEILIASSRRIREPNNILAAHYPPRRRGIMGRCKRTIIPGPIGKLRVASCSDEMEAFAVPGSEKAKGCFTQPQRLLQHRLEHRREVAG